MIKMKKLSGDKFYGIDYKTFRIIELTEKELEETYTVKRTTTGYYCTEENKMFIKTTPDFKDVTRYYKLYKENGDVAKELEIGDVVRDKEDFIYKVIIIDDDFYCKLIGDCVPFSSYLYDDIDYIDEGDEEDYDCEID